jgi:NADH-quinone oxidoreductase subunit C
LCHNLEYGLAVVKVHGATTIGFVPPAQLSDPLSNLAVATHESRLDTWLRVESSTWKTAAEQAKDDGFTYLSFVSAVDWQPNPDLDGEHVFDSSKTPAEPQPVIVEPEIRYAGGETRFQVLARVYDVTTHNGLTLVADVPDDTLTVPSLTPVFHGADWHERETWEMFGIVFDGHPGLRHLYLPSEFEGFPLRKDFPLMSRVVRPWPGFVDMEEMPPVEKTGEES